MQTRELLEQQAMNIIHEMPLDELKNFVSHRWQSEQNAEKGTDFDSALNLILSGHFKNATSGTKKFSELKHIEKQLDR
jgi:hypothetical protein